MRQIWVAWHALLYILLYIAICDMLAHNMISCNMLEWNNSTDSWLLWNSLYLTLPWTTLYSNCLPSHGTFYLFLEMLSWVKWTDLQSTAIWLGTVIGMLGLAGCSQNFCQKNWQQNWSSTFSEQARTNGQRDIWTNGQRDIAKQDRLSRIWRQIINHISIITAFLLVKQSLHFVATVYFWY